MMTCLICNERGAKGGNISFHTFPKDADRRKMWLDAFRLPPTINKYATVCSKHFTDDNFVLDKVLYQRRLKNTAVPTLNLVRIIKSHKLFYSIKPFPENSANKQNILTATPTIKSNLLQVPTNAVILSPPNILPIKESDTNSNKQSYTVISKDTSSNVSNLDCSSIIDCSMQDSVKIIQLFVPEKELPFNPVATQDSFVVTPTVKNDPLEEVPSNSFCSIQNASHITPIKNNQENFVKQLIAVPCSCGNGIEPAVDNNRNLPIKQDLTSDSESTLVNESQLNIKKPPTKRKIWNPRYVGDVKLEHLDDPKQRKRNWEMAVKKIQEQQKEIKVLRQSKRRLKLHLKSMKDLVSNKKKSNTVADKKCQTMITYPPQGWGKAQPTKTHLV